MLSSAQKGIFEVILVTAACPSLLPLSIFYSSMMSENNANLDERTYILSRPISRNSYMTGKLLSSLTMVFLLFIIVLIIYISGFFLSGSNDEHELKNRSIITYPFSMLVCMSVGAIMGTCYKYYLKEKLISVIMLVIALGAMLTTQVVMGTMGSDYEITDQKIFDVMTIYIVFCGFLPIGILGAIGGYIFTNKANVMV
jgi:ABC-type Na+ efflux pump permease subunit